MTAASSPRDRWWRLVRRLGALLVTGLLAVITRGSTVLDLVDPEADLVPDYRPVTRSTSLDDRETLSFGRPPPSSLRAARSAPSRWIVLCWDGASWDLILPLLSEGRMPNLASVMSEGAYGNLLTIQPTLSPVVWTTVATGVSPAGHGVVGLQKGRAEGTIRDPGAPLYDNADRRVKALWNLLTENGRSVVMAGYHATFPAEPVSGIMLSNYAIRREHSHGYLAPSVDADAAGRFLVYPPQRLADVMRTRRRPADLRWQEIRRFVDVTEAEFASRAASAVSREDAQNRWAYLLKAYLHDEFHAQAGLRYWRQVRPTVALVHFQSLDWAGHHFLYFHWPERFLNLAGRAAADAGDVRAFKPTVAAFHEYVDEWLGRFLRVIDDETGLMILSDHGMEPVPDKPLGGHDFAPPGVLVITGPGITPGTRIRGATVYDILPTLMASLGLPLADETSGRVLLYPPSVSGSPRVASYGPHQPPGPAPSDLGGITDRVREELRAMGYIQ